MAYRIIVDLSDRKLHLLEGNIVRNTYPIAVGAMLTQSPEGEYKIVNKVPNPGGPYGSFWMGLSKPHYGIHGTNNPSSIGHAVSHGCIRLLNRDVNALAANVSIGTRVTIRK
ncbi:MULTISPECIES: L,D-transpeptidase [Paenibacillus]|uniref:L,D-transpeptidase n=1 Tax=Paenibacillus TaxID=44249 RepID=UPI0022B88E3D|nr:L,D-transpeptidase [Paenibacillus caseinilyticus]MCZ8523436.1 L,D-transpeptidase [Paenibacillus caseinilyticus]